MVNAFYGVTNEDSFAGAMQEALNQVKVGGIFLGDNLFTFHKNLGFLHDEAFVTAFNTHATGRHEQAAMWRIYTLCWAAKRSLRVPGDFVECACYKGTTARIVVDYVNFASQDRSYYLYDLFDHAPEAKRLKLDSHSPELYEQVRTRFDDIANVNVTRGKVPDILHEVAPATIAMMHIDLNDVTAELGALEMLFERLSPGGTLVLDDFGWLGYQAQQKAEVAFFAERGYDVLEMPTGQGLVIK
jgi:hypothetical protein